MLIFRFDNPGKSLRWCCGDSGIRNGAPVKVSRRTLRRWEKHYYQYGEPPAITKKNFAPEGNRSLNCEQQQALRELALGNIHSIKYVCVYTFFYEEFIFKTFIHSHS